MILKNLISIIIPSRTQDYILNDCIREIRKIYTTVKIFVILDEINETKYDENVILIKSENRNMSAKRNLGVKLADTKYIAFLDSDAYPLNNGKWLEKSIEFLENNENYAAVTGPQLNPPSDTYIQKCIRYIRFSRLLTHENLDVIADRNPKEHDNSGEFVSANLIMRKDVYNKLNGMDENIYLAEDNEFSTRLDKRGYKVRFLPEVTVYHSESKLYPFLRKTWCMSYYYANMFVRGKLVKDLNDILLGFFPLAGIFIFVFLVLLFLYLNINYIPLITIPLVILMIILIESFNISKKLESGKKYEIPLIFTIFCLYLSVWVIGSLAGFLFIPCKKVQDLYKHY